MSGVFPYLFITVLILFSAFFSGSEIAYASVNKLRLRKRAESGRLADKTSLYISEHYDAALITILIGNNLVNIASSSIATVIATSLMGDDGAWLATFIITVLILTFGEIMPKVIASRKVMEFTKLISIPLRVMMLITRPIVWAINGVLTRISSLWKSLESDDDIVTEDDLETIIETVEDEGVVDEDTADLLQSALDFTDVLAYEILTPRVDMVSIDIDDSEDEKRSVLMGTNFTRVPVYRDTVDNIIGIINMNIWLLSAVRDHDFSIEHAMTEPLFVHKTMPIHDVLSLMKKEKKHMAVVTDEYGGTAGLLTMEDILEQIVGEIWDEYDIVEPEFERLADDLYRADGDMRILDLFEELDLDDRDFDDDNATLGGWAVEQLGDYADIGDSFTFQNLIFTVTAAENRRVLSLEVQVTPTHTAEGEDER